MNRVIGKVKAVFIPILNDSSGVKDHLMCLNLCKEKKSSHFVVVTGNNLTGIAWMWMEFDVVAGRL